MRAVAGAVGVSTGNYCYGNLLLFSYLCYLTLQNSAFTRDMSYM